MAFRRNRSRHGGRRTVRNLHSAFLRVGLKLSGKGGRYHAYLTEEGSIVA